jgi:conjugative transfer region protein TrbK
MVAGALCFRPTPPGTSAAAATAWLTTDREQLESCRAKGEAAASDSQCQTAWRAARARFLGARP